MRAGLAAAVAALVVLAAVAVLADDEGRDAARASTRGSSRPETRSERPGVTFSTSTTAAEAVPVTSPTTLAVPTAPITLAFAGDTNFEGAGLDLAGRLRPMQDVFALADLTVVNLETAIATNSPPIGGKQFTFGAPPEALDAMASNGVDAVSMANNHGMDHGEDGLLESLAAKATSPIPVLGIGANEDEAFAPFSTEVKGHRIAVIAATQVLDSSLIESWTATEDKAGLASAKRTERLLEEVRAADADHHLVVVFLHWGIERQDCPSEAQKALALQLSEAGADVIVGGHAHRLQGGGRLGTAVVDYGLGNFGFYANSASGATTGVFTVRARGQQIESYSWIPGQIRDRMPHPLTGDAASAALAAWEALRGCTGLAP